MNYIAFQDKEVQRMFALMPRAINAAVNHTFYSERKSYVGNRGQAGLFRRQLMRKQRKGRPGGWPQNVANAFMGFVENRGQLQGKELHMGEGFGHSNSFTEGLARMEDGFTAKPISTKTMPIPIYENLAAIGITSNFNKAFHKLWNTSQIEVINVHGRVMYFHDAGKGNHGSLLFVGAGSVKVKPQFKFVGSFKKRLPRIMNKGERLIKQTLRGIERGYIEAT